jgi:hypothetical protein
MSSQELLRCVSGLILPIFDAHCRPTLEQAIAKITLQDGGDFLRVVVDPNFVQLAGLCVACAVPAPPEDAHALAWAAALAGELPWRLSRRARRAIFQCCAHENMEGVPPGLAVLALRATFRCIPLFRTWRRLLSALAAMQQWELLLSRSRSPGSYARTTLRALHKDQAAELRVGWSEKASRYETLLVAELIALAYVALGRFDRRMVRRWVLPLIERSTGLFLPRTRAAGFVCEHLHALGEGCAAEFAGMIERGIAPLAWDDYSNFRQAFSMKSWPLLRCFLTKAGIVTELERFVTEADRTEFWRWFDGKGAEKC